jgi:hypothetical protein
LLDSGSDSEVSDFDFDALDEDELLSMWYSFKLLNEELSPKIYTDGHKERKLVGLEDLNTWQQ